jgi:hypothetical protein
MNLRITFAVILLLILSGCVGIAPDETTAIRDTVYKMVAGEDAALSENPQALSRGKVTFVSEYSAFAWQGWAEWDSWLLARGRYDAQHNVLQTKTFVHGIRRIDVRGHFASVVLDDTISRRENGRIIREHGVEGFLLNGSGGKWRVEGVARLNTGEIARGSQAEIILDSAQAEVRRLNTDFVVPAELVDTVLIEDDLQDWQRLDFGGDAQDPHRAPLMQGDPDMEIIPGRVLRLDIGNSDSFVILSAALQSKATGHIKGRGRIGLVLGKSIVTFPNAQPWVFEAMAWVPD